jgi:hypothetical protein
MNHKRVALYFLNILNYQIQLYLRLGNDRFPKDAITIVRIRAQ